MDTQTTAPQTSANRTSAMRQGTNTQEATAAAGKVASTAADEARRVGSDAGHQVRHLMGQTRDDLRHQAAAQQSRVASGLRELADQLRDMADGSESDGMARTLVDDVSRRAGEAAGWLDSRDPGSVLDEARGFARRRPGTFLALAAGVGVLAGRLSRSLIDEARDDGDPQGRRHRSRAAGHPGGHDLRGGRRWGDGRHRGGIRRDRNLWRHHAIGDRPHVRLRVHDVGNAVGGTDGWGLADGAPRRPAPHGNGRTDDRGR